jgi:hypothetical protein
MKDFLKNLANLLKVKTLVTLAMVFSAVLFIASQIELPDWYIALVSSVVTYYFTKKDDTESGKV